MEQFCTKVSKGGRVVIPAEVRRKLGLDVGEDVILSVRDQQLVLMSRDEALRQAQELVCAAIPPDVSLVDDLLAERRREAD